MVTTNSTTTLAGRLSDRDHAVVSLVGAFRQMTTSQVRDSLFLGLASTTPLDRTLKRLTGAALLARLERPQGGHLGGSGQFVHQLGRAGWKLLGKPGHYWAPRAINLHTLAIADCYASLKRAEYAGGQEVISFTTEPACHQVVGNINLTPDGLVELGNRATRTKRSFFLEVDRGTERLDQIQDKCERYWRAYQLWPEPFYPTVLFVVPDARRKAQIERVIGGGPKEAKRLMFADTFESILKGYKK